MGNTSNEPTHNGSNKNDNEIPQGNIRNKRKDNVEEWQVIKPTSNKSPLESTNDKLIKDKTNIHNPYKNIFNIQVKNHLQKKHNQSVNVYEIFTNFIKSLLNAVSTAILIFGATANKNSITNRHKAVTGPGPRPKGAWAKTGPDPNGPGGLVSKEPGTNGPGSK